VKGRRVGMREGPEGAGARRAGSRRRSPSRTMTTSTFFTKMNKESTNVKRYKRELTANQMAG